MTPETFFIASGVLMFFSHLLSELQDPEPVPFKVDNAVIFHPGQFPGQRTLIDTQISGHAFPVEWQDNIFRGS